MNERDKAMLLERGRDCLSALRALFDGDLQRGAYDVAESWAHEYAGAAKVLEAQRLITREEYDAWTEGVFGRYRRVRYRRASPEEEA